MNDGDGSEHCKETGEGKVDGFQLPLEPELELE